MALHNIYSVFPLPYFLKLSLDQKKLSKNMKINKQDLQLMVAIFLVIVGITLLFSGFWAVVAGKYTHIEDLYNIVNQ